MGNLYHLSICHEIPCNMVNKFLSAISCKITNYPKITFRAEKVTEFKKWWHIPWITKKPSMSLPNKFNCQIYWSNLPVLFIIRNFYWSNLPVLFMVGKKSTEFHSFLRHCFARSSLNTIFVCFICNRGDTYYRITAGSRQRS